MSGALLKDLRDLSVTVLHPSDTDGESLVSHLRRIGCRVDPRWPIPEEPPEPTDILITTVDRDVHDQVKALIKKFGEPKPAIMAVVNYENPATLQLVLEMEALAVIGKPIRPFGLLTNLVLSRNLLLSQRTAAERIRKLEAKIAGQKKIAKAKSILMETQALSEKEAYESLRAQAMAKRISMEQIAVAIINANELLSFRLKGD
ncbi:ANTAR domain-containing protein [Marivibrio halodurans]|uniref:ANTAR domain-containing protein n=1 Tax=Marivibrio halodurans TaxID=2039722 RepID=A0A8J7S7U2_9PROT|nr:ANTAR domain-containing protein [Marivibrio halodurans]MBP5858414.1 ANTAR domain-containing protein [Marivibrio halodurans]